MRFAGLDLLAYGHFTDRRLAFTPGETDLHIVFGPNEAGKSTARRAVGDFLFGFPTQTDLNFVHAYNALRIGARIEAGEAEIEAIRKKGRKNTLLDADGARRCLETVEEAASTAARAAVLQATDEAEMPPLPSSTQTAATSNLCTEYSSLFQVGLANSHATHKPPRRKAGSHLKNPN